MTFSTTLAEGTLTILFDRVEVHNALDLAAIDDLHKILGEVPPEAEFVLFRTAGEKAFLAGGDLREFHEKLNSKEKALGMALKVQAILDKLERLEQITLAVADGFAFGGGAEFLLPFDRVFLHTRSRIAFRQIKFAISCGWGGATRLIRKIGYHQALDLLLSTRELGASEATAMGLVEEMGDNPLELANGYIELLKEAPREARRQIKQFFATQRSLDYPGSFFKENIAFRRLWGEPDHRARVQRFLDRGTGN